MDRLPTPPRRTALERLNRRAIIRVDYPLARAETALVMLDRIERSVQVLILQIFPTGGSIEDSSLEEDMNSLIERLIAAHVALVGAGIDRLAFRHHVSRQIG